MFAIEQSIRQSQAMTLSALLCALLLVAACNSESDGKGGAPSESASGQAVDTTPKDDKEIKQDEPVCKAPDALPAALALPSEVQSAKKLHEDGRLYVRLKFSDKKTGQAAVAKARAGLKADGWTDYDGALKGNFSAFKGEQSIDVAPYEVTYTKQVLSFDQRVFLPTDAQEVWYGVGGFGFQFTSASATSESVMAVYEAKGWERGKGGEMRHKDDPSSVVQIVKSPHVKDQWVLMTVSDCVR